MTTSYAVLITYLNQSAANVLSNNPTTTGATVWTPINVTLFSIGLIGVVANLFAAFVICWYRPLLQRIPNYFLLNQCILDLIAGLLLCVDIGMADYETENFWQFSAYCIVIRSRMAFSGLFLASILNLVALAVERYAEIVHPIKHKLSLTGLKVVLVCMAVWLVGLVSRFVVTITTVSPSTGACSVGATASDAVNTALALFLFADELALPIGVVAFCYTSMALKVRKMAVVPMAVLSFGDSKRPQMLRIRRNIIRLLAIVLVVLFLSVAPRRVLVLIEAADATTIDTGDLMMSVCVVLNYSNCCVNPFIYLFKYEEFQKAVRALLRARSNVVASGVYPMTSNGSRKSGHNVEPYVIDVSVIAAADRGRGQLGIIAEVSG